MRFTLKREAKVRDLNTITLSVHRAASKRFIIT